MTTDTLPRFSLDTPPSTRTVVLSGYNFREVAPEVLSPLTWSVVGAGMERGMRAVAEGLGVRSQRAAPEYVAYVAFRPYHVATTIEELIQRIPGVEASDLWHLVFGGAGARDEAPRHRLRPIDALHLTRELRFFIRTNREDGKVAATVARAEALTLDALEARHPWAVGAAADAAVAAGRDAWHLHMRATSQAVAVAGMVCAELERTIDRPSARELLDTLARRAGGIHLSSARPGRIRSGAERMVSYEVADRSTRFRAWNRAHKVDQAAAGRSPASRSPAASPSATVELVSGTSLARSGRRALVRWLEVALGDREASKQLGLRALHCLRTLLDAELLGSAGSGSSADAGSGPGADPGDLALLGAHELRRLPAERQAELIEARSGELEAARRLVVAPDMRQRADGTTQPLPRTTGLVGDDTVGDALAPGWWEGVLTDDPTVAEGILCRPRVEAHHVMTGAARGVVAEYGSALSHVAIVCRELGIPFVAGLGVEPGLLGRRATIDGWTGRVVVDGPVPARASRR